MPIIGPAHRLNRRLGQCLNSHNELVNLYVVEASVSLRVVTGFEFPLCVFALFHLYKSTGLSQLLFAGPCEWRVPALLLGSHMSLQGLGTSRNEEPFN